MNEFDLQMSRTLSVVRQLAKGKQLTLSESLTLGMGENMAIGFVYKFNSGEKVVDDLSLSQLNALLEQYEVFAVIPDKF